MLRLTEIGDEALDDLVGNIFNVLENWVADLTGAEADNRHAWGWMGGGEEKARVEGGDRGRKVGREGGKKGRREGGRACRKVAGGTYRR